MVAPEAAGLVSPLLAHTAILGARVLAEARRLMDACFDDFADADWSHALGGMHAVVVDAGVLVAHGSLVQRRLLHGDRSLCCGYVEAVAVHPDHRGRGLGHTVMVALESLAPAYDVLALSASDAGFGLYRSLGWQPWRGPYAVLGPAGP